MRQTGPLFLVDSAQLDIRCDWQTREVIVIACPGQGSQTPGFLEPWLTEPGFREHLGTLSDVVGIDLIAHGTVSDADTIRDTAVAQPLIVAAGLLTIEAVLAGGRRERINGVAGHSVGEITAAAAAGILTGPDAMLLVRARGEAMAAAAALTATAMSAVIGADETELLDRVAELGLEPANFNGGGQIVVAGETGALQQLKDKPPSGARVIPLQVAGAFHTRYMTPAVDRLRQVATTLTPSDPALTIWTNRDGSVVTSGKKFLDLLVGQVSSPVRWDKTMDAFTAMGVTGVIEVAPAGALVGLVKRALKGVPTVAVRTPDDLTAAHEMIDGNV